MVTVIAEAVAGLQVIPAPGAQLVNELKAHGVIFMLI
jgi:hypothetical protein